MKQNLIIQVDDQPVNHSQNVPDRLSKGLFPGADRHCISEPDVDVLVQKISTGKNNIWKYDLIPHKSIKILFEQAIEMTYLVVNLGLDTAIQFGTSEIKVLRSNHYKVVRKSPFSITVYPEPSFKMYELMLFEINEDRFGGMLDQYDISNLIHS